MSNPFGIRIRDKETGAVTFDSTTDRTAFWIEEITLGTGQNLTKSYPALVGKKLLIVQHAVGGWGNAYKSIEVTYPGNIPTITVTGTATSVPVALTILSTGDL